MDFNEGVVTMKKTFRILALILSVCLTLSVMTSCGKETVPADGSTAAQTEAAAEQTAAQSTTDAQLTTAADETLTETASETQPTTEAAAETTTEATTEAASDPETTTEAPKDKTPQTKEEILALYNEAANRIKPQSKAIVSNYTINTQTSDANISSKILQPIANKLISANMGKDKSKTNVTYTSAADKNKNFPVSGQSWTSKLTTADVSKATITEKDGVYTVTLYLLPDTTPNIKAGQGHAGKGMSIITKESIVEGAGSAGMRVIEESSIKVTFKDCRITAKIDKATGNITDANYYLDWTLSLTALGIDIAVSFGAEDDYSIRW